LQAKDEYFNNASRFSANPNGFWLGVDMTMTANFRLAEMRRLLAVNYSQCYTGLDTKLTRLDLYAAKVGSNNPLLARFGDGIDVALDEPIPSVTKGTFSL